MQITQVGSQGETVEVDGSHEVQSTTDADKWRYSLANILPAMKAGQWGFSTSGDAVTVYAWPSDASNMQDRIEYSARTFCINIDADMPGAVTLEALDVRQAGGDGSNTEGTCIGTRTSSLGWSTSRTPRHRPRPPATTGSGVANFFLDPRYLRRQPTRSTWAANNTPKCAGTS